MTQKELKTKWEVVPSMQGKYDVVIIQSFKCHVGTQKVRKFSITPALFHLI
jgi:hypothetical protein